MFGALWKASCLVLMSSAVFHHCLHKVLNSKAPYFFLAVETWIND